MYEPKSFFSQEIFFSSKIFIDEMEQATIFVYHLKDWHLF